jgi:hypothetical protein
MHGCPAAAATDGLQVWFTKEDAPLLALAKDCHAAMAGNYYGLFPIGNLSVDNRPG